VVTGRRAVVDVARAVTGATVPGEMVVVVRVLVGEAEVVVTRAVAEVVVAARALVLVVGMASPLPPRQAPPIMASAATAANLVPHKLR